jgi:hypothetical protein
VQKEPLNDTRRAVNEPNAPPKTSGSVCHGCGQQRSREGRDKRPLSSVAFSTEEEFNLAVRFAHVVEADALRDIWPFTRLNIRRLAAGGRAGCTSRRVPRGIERHSLEAGREVGVRLACTFLAPHHSRRPVAAIVTAARAPSRDLLTVPIVLGLYQWH